MQRKSKLILKTEAQLSSIVGCQTTIFDVILKNGTAGKPH